MVRRQSQVKARHLAVVAALSLLLGSSLGAPGSRGTEASIVAEQSAASGLPTTTVPTPTGDMLNPAVTQASIATTICKAGYTATVRPPTSVTGPLKVHQIASYGYQDTSVANYEEDHVIALELGGAPAATVNLYPEPKSSSGADDSLENLLRARVCARLLSLADAQAQIFAAKLRHGYRQLASAGQPAPAPG